MCSVCVLHAKLGGCEWRVEVDVYKRFGFTNTQQKLMTPGLVLTAGLWVTAAATTLVPVGRVLNQSVARGFSVGPITRECERQLRPMLRSIRGQCRHCHDSRICSFRWARRLR
eukprot:m.62371 g.62371  ORF g.62371 m.62371 type:complete len:113 (+) comp17675_c0_seq5:103-441(+)